MLSRMIDPIVLLAVQISAGDSVARRLVLQIEVHPAFTRAIPVRREGGERLPAHEARRLMLEESYEVGTAALDVGYENSTQFIREYRRLFGEAPLRNIKTLRTTGLTFAAT
jgi:transcriptional regulator GlxA family with amidase domain